MSGLRRYERRKVALLTKHGKEKVIVPLLDTGLGCSIELVKGFDTDLLGTFTREIPRVGTQLEAARQKARKGMELSGSSLGIASEGSFGLDPFIGMLPWNMELLIWIDDELEIEVVGIAQGAARGPRITSGDWQAIANFATMEGFPEYQLVMRSDEKDDRRVCKDIASWERLKTSFDDCIALSASKQVFLELDMRAFANPQRMERIEQAATDLLKRLQSPCPICNTPGFWIRERQPGLPCESCGLPTQSYMSEVWACLCCEHKDIVMRTDRSTADPVHCSFCNP